MQLTKEQLTDAYEQGLSISTRNGNIKIVTILGDVYGVNHCDTNSKLVKWWMFENFKRNEAKIEQHKPKIDFSILKEGEIYYAKANTSEIVFKHKGRNTKIHSYAMYFISYNKTFTNYSMCNIDSITELRLPTESELELFYSKFPELNPKKYNGRAVKCDNVEQLRYVATKHKSEYLNHIELNFKEKYNYYDYEKDTFRSETGSIDADLKIISFSDYCKEQCIKEPKWVQCFEVRDGYNDVVMVSDDKNYWYPCILLSVNDLEEYPFETVVLKHRYCRYLNKNEINEIKFVTND